MSKVDCAVILAGGKGTRLRPMTSNKPKPMVPVTLTPMIDFAFKQIVESGISKVIVAVKYLGEQIREYLEKNEQYSHIDIHIPNIDPIGTADAIREVADLIEGDFVVSMADIVSNFSIKQMIDFFYKTKSYSTISLKNIDFPTKKFGVILLDEENNIDIFLEKPRPDELLFTTLPFAYRHGASFHHNLVNTGMYVFNRKVIEILENFSDITDFGQHVFPYLLQERFKLSGYPYDYYWLDCGNLKSYLWANWDILRGFMQGFRPPGKYERGSWLGENVKIDQSAKIIPPVVLGDNVYVGPNSTIGPFVVIDKDTQINSETQIHHSVLWSDVCVEEGVIIEDSVVCDRCTIDSHRTITKYSAIGTGVTVAIDVKSANLQ